MNRSIIKTTEGPWRWELSEKSKHVRLVGGVPTFDKTVMDFVRYGMGGAAPRFRDTSEGGLNLMYRVEEFAEIVPGREHHASWFQAINHPDARLIATAPLIPLMLEALEAWENYCSHSDGVSRAGSPPEAIQELWADMRRAEALTLRALAAAHRAAEEASA
jgi:hypothetical protein